MSYNPDWHTYFSYLVQIERYIAAIDKSKTTLSKKQAYHIQSRILVCKLGICKHVRLNEMADFMYLPQYTLRKYLEDAYDYKVLFSHRANMRLRRHCTKYNIDDSINLHKLAHDKFGDDLYKGISIFTPQFQMN